jgi:hypothetical protein
VGQLMMDVRALIDRHLRATKLEILVFGPAVHPPSTDPYVASLQQKRKQIKERLLSEGHNALFGEDIVDPSLPSHLTDPLLQEVVAAGEADLIVVLVGSPGSIFEAQAISSRRELCAKAAFYCFEDHEDGLVVQHLRYMRTFGATCQLVSLADVNACHLTAAVLDKVAAIQIAKALLH